MSALVVFLVELKPPYPRHVYQPRHWNRYHEKYPNIRRANGLIWAREPIEHAHPKKGRHPRARKECKGEDSNRFHRSTVLPSLFGHLSRCFRDLDVQQIVSPTFFGDFAGALCKLDVQLVIPLLNRIEDLASNVSNDLSSNCFLNLTALDWFFIRRGIISRSMLTCFA